MLSKRVLINLIKYDTKNSNLRFDIAHLECLEYAVNIGTINQCPGTIYVKRVGR